MMCECSVRLRICMCMCRIGTYIVYDECTCTRLMVMKFNCFILLNQDVHVDIDKETFYCRIVVVAALHGTCTVHAT